MTRLLRRACEAVHTTPGIEPVVYVDDAQSSGGSADISSEFMIAAYRDRIGNGRSTVRSGFINYLIAVDPFEQRGIIQITIS